MLILQQESVALRVSRSRHLFFIFRTKVWQSENLGRQSCRDSWPDSGQDTDTQIPSIPVLKKAKCPLFVQIVYPLADLWYTFVALSDFGERSELSSLFSTHNLCSDTYTVADGVETVAHNPSGCKHVFKMKTFVEKLVKHLMLLLGLHHHGNAA